MKKKIRIDCGGCPGFGVTWTSVWDSMMSIVACWFKDDSGDCGWKKNEVSKKFRDEKNFFLVYEVKQNLKIND